MVKFLISTMSYLSNERLQKDLLRGSSPIASCAGYCIWGLRLVSRIGVMIGHQVYFAGYRCSCRDISCERESVCRFYEVLYHCVRQRFEAVLEVNKSTCVQTINILLFVRRAYLYLYIHRSDISAEIAQCSYNYHNLASVKASPYAEYVKLQLSPLTSFDLVAMKNWSTPHIVPSVVYSRGILGYRMR